MEGENEDKRDHTLKAETGEFKVTGFPVGVGVLHLGANPIANTVAIFADALKSPGRYTFIVGDQEQTTVPSQVPSTKTAASPQTSAPAYKATLIVVAIITILCIGGAVYVGLTVGTHPTDSQKSTLSFLQAIATLGFGALCGLLGGKQL